MQNVAGDGVLAASPRAAYVATLVKRSSTANNDAFRASIAQHNVSGHWGPFGSRASPGSPESLGVDTGHEGAGRSGLANRVTAAGTARVR
jgi:hypothetical protein